MNSDSLELSSALKYDNKRVISGYPLRNSIAPVGSSPYTRFDTTSQFKQYEFGGSNVNAYLKKMAFVDRIQIPVPFATGQIRVLLKQCPLKTLKLTSRSGKEIFNTNELLYTAVEYFHVDKKISDNNPHEMYGDNMRAHLVVNSVDYDYKNFPLPNYIANIDGTASVAGKPAYVEVCRVFRLDKVLESLFSQGIEIPMSEIVVVQTELPPQNEISYLYTCVGAADNVNTAQNKVLKILNNGYPLPNYSAVAAPTSNSANDIQTALLNTVGSINQANGGVAPIQQHIDTALVETTLTTDNRILISKFNLYYAYERNEKINLMLSKMLNEASSGNAAMMIPYVNVVSTPYQCAGNSTSQDITHRITSSIGAYIRALYLTLSYPNPTASLQKSGSYNTCYIGDARLQRIEIYKDAKNLVSMNIKEFEHEMMPYGFGTSYYADHQLEGQYYLTNYATSAESAALSHNQGRFRMLAKDSFFFPIYFEEASENNPEWQSVLAGDPISGDSVITIRLTFDKNVHPDGYRLTVTQHGIRHLKLDNRSIDAI